MQTFIAVIRFVNMKALTFRLSFAVLLTVLISCTQVSQRGDSDILFDSATDDVSLIQREIIRINQITSEIRIFNFKCDEEVEVTYFLDKGKAVKIIIDWAIVGDHYHKEEFYFKDGKLIFDYDYLEGGPACEACSTVSEKKSYIVDDQAIQVLENDTLKNCSECDYQNDDKAYQIYPARSPEQLEEILCPDI